MTIEETVNEKRGYNKLLHKIFGDNKIYNLLIQLIHGCLLTLAFHPFDIFLVIPIAFSGFLWCLEKEIVECVNLNKKEFFKIGFKHTFTFFFGHFLSSLYWIINPLFFEIKKYWFLVPFGCVVLPMFLSLFYSIIGGVICSQYLLKVVQSKTFSKLFTKINIAFIFAVGFFIAEILRSNLFLAFPWNLLGYASGYSLSLMQLASITGVYGLSLLLYFVGTVPYTKNSIAISIMTIIIVIITMYGNKRLHSIQTSHNRNLIKLYVVQPNIGYHYHQYERQLQALAKTKNIIKQNIAKSSSNSNDINLIVLPESAIPFILNKYQNVLPDDFMSKYSANSFLISGIDRYDDKKYYNSMILVNNNGEIIDSYDKTILTPFGEYIPGYNMLKSILKPIVGNNYGFTPGTKTRNIRLYQASDYDESAPLIIMPMICFESIFTDINKQRDIYDVDLIVNITNDVWLGNSIGPYQHLAMSRMRAIEYGIPLVRSAKTGVSAVFNAYGQVIQEIKLGVEGVIIVEMPEQKVETIYMKFLNVFKKRDFR